MAKEEGTSLSAKSEGPAVAVEEEEVAMYETTRGTKQNGSQRGILALVGHLGSKFAFLLLHLRYVS